MADGTDQQRPFPARRMQDAVTWKPIELVRGRSGQQLGALAVDVYGDQTIWYLSTPGHSPDPPQSWLGQDA